MTGKTAAIDSIDKVAAEIGADLVVAGGYGHSRLREWAFGGMTRSLLGKGGLHRLFANETEAAAPEGPHRFRGKDTTRRPDAGRVDLWPRDASWDRRQRGGCSHWHDGLACLAMAASRS